jgi:hypothetical protein
MSVDVSFCLLATAHVFVPGILSVAKFGLSPKMAGVALVKDHLQ